jgi:hypothetical protein
MTAARTGSLGVADTTGDLYVVDVDGNLERVPVGADGQVLVADAAALGPSGSIIGVKWENPAFLAKDSFQADAVDAVFKKITYTPDALGPVSNPSTDTRGTHFVLKFPANTLRRIPWQKHTPAGYNGGSLRVSIWWVPSALAVAPFDNVLLAAAFERDNSGFDVDTDDFGTLKSVAATAGAAGVIVRSDITFTQAEADGVVAGEPLRLFLQRTVDPVDPDEFPGDVLLVRVVVEEL